MARIFGARAHGDRLRRLSGPLVKRRVGDAIENGLERIRKRAQNSIIEGSVSGPGHVPSSPGEPPNADTHELDQSGRVEMNRQTLSGKTTFQAEHAVPLEFGADGLEERPYLGPAAKVERPSIRQEVAAAVRSTSRGV